jgi:hypothetical protein
MKSPLLILVCITLAMSCGRAKPAGFWTNFHKDLLIKNTSDHGPWGGHSTWVWESNTSTFTDAAVIDFATKNGWTITDSLTLSADTINSTDLPALKGDAYSVDLLKSTLIPTLELGDCTILIFKTGWLAVEPGNTRETLANGFAVSNAAGTRLAIYQHWGE